MNASQSRPGLETEAAEDQAGSQTNIDIIAANVAAAITKLHAVRTIGCPAGCGPIHSCGVGEPIPDRTAPDGRDLGVSERELIAMQMRGDV